MANRTKRSRYQEAKKPPGRTPLQKRGIKGADLSWFAGSLDTNCKRGGGNATKTINVRKDRPKKEKKSKKYKNSQTDHTQKSNTAH